MRNDRVVGSALCVLALTVSLTGCHSNKYSGSSPGVSPEMAARGVDVFQTSTGSGTSVDFSPTPIPPGFFCPGSPAFNGQVKLHGVPLTTNPAGVAGASDTIVERLKDANFGGAPVTVPVIVRALQLTSDSPLTINCSTGPTSWRLDACLCGDQPTTDIAVRVDEPCGCGHFDGSLKLKTCLRFTNMADGKVLGPIPQDVGLKIKGMPWCPKPMARSIVISSSFSVRNCDNKEVNLPGTSNFFPGLTCAQQGPGVDCWTQFASLTHCHEGPTPDHPHCINPVCGERPN